MITLKRGHFPFNYIKARYFYFGFPRWGMTVANIGFQNFQSIGDDKMRLALPLGTVSGAAPAVGVRSRLQMLVESEVIEAKIDAAVWSEIKLNC